MPFRSHLGRSMDMARPSNRLIVALTLVSAVAAGVVVWDGGETHVLLAPPYTFAIWALVRELDPDHDGTALVAAFAAGVWVVIGLDPSGIVFTVGLVVAARLALSSTGRRPLATDLIGVVVIGAAVSFTTTGWVAGFAIAVAIYVDDRMAEVERTMSLVATLFTALATSIVATLASAFPEAVPRTMPGIVVPVGLLALVAFVREPVEPTSVVDSRRGNRLSRDRLHAALGLSAVAIFGAAVLSGRDAEALGPVAIALALALASNELERLRRKR